jgi:predicted transcriptional regulator
MARPMRDVTETELAILQALWDLDTATVRQLVERLYPDGGPSAPATVQKLLERLEGKDLVARDRSGLVHRFSARIDRGELISARLRGVAEDLCGGSLASLLTHLVRTESLSGDERQALRDLVERWEPHGQERGRKKPHGKHEP